MPTYTIQCYIETLSSDNKITLRGSDGYKLLKDENKYLIFFKGTSKATHCKLFNESEEFTIDQTDTNNNISNMLLVAQANHKKVELIANITIQNKPNQISIKIKTMKLL